MQLLHDYALISDWLVPPSPKKRDKKKKKTGGGRGKDQDRRKKQLFVFVRALRERLWHQVITS